MWSLVQTVAWIARRDETLVERLADPEAGPPRTLLDLMMELGDGGTGIRHAESRLLADLRAGAVVAIGLPESGALHEPIPHIAWAGLRFFTDPDRGPYAGLSGRRLRRGHPAWTSLCFDPYQFRKAKSVPSGPERPRTRRRDTKLDALTRGRIVAVLAAMRRRWPDVKKRPPERAMAVALEAELRRGGGYGVETIRKILSGDYPAMRRLGIPPPGD
jgi:hypothetical protein